MKKLVIAVIILFHSNHAALCTQTCTVGQVGIDGLCTTCSSLTGDPHSTSDGGTDAFTKGILGCYVTTGSDSTGTFQYVPRCNYSVDASAICSQMGSTYTNGNCDGSPLFVSFNRREGATSWWGETVQEVCNEQASEICGNAYYDPISKGCYITEWCFDFLVNAAGMDEIDFFPL